MPRIKRDQTHADQFKDLEDHAPAEFDPEDDFRDAESSDDSSPEHEGQDGLSARDHYELVGRSKLRQQEPATLGPQYAGSRVARKDAAASDDEHDPFQDHSSDDGSNLNEEELEDEDRASDLEGQDLDEEDSEIGSGTGNTSLSDGDDTEMQPGRTYEEERAELRKIMDEQSDITVAISQATKVDAEKGRAVKRQRKTFDALLNTRIRLQQALVASNTMQVDSPDALSYDKAPYAAAEAAALNIWNTISSLRHAVTNDASSAVPPAKITTSTPTATIWSQMQSLEATAHKHRTSTLNKWSRRTATTSTDTAAPRRLDSSASNTQQPISTILASHLSAANLPRLLARTRIPRSCAPAHLLPSTGPAHIYDDADFYARLLQDLLAQRQLDDLAAPIAPHEDAAGGATDLAAHARAARQAARTRRAVDTRASKGRKLRYTVHEKLQSFMAPEADRGSWGARAREELFAGLLGRRVALEEDEAVDRGDGVDDADKEAVGEEEALVLFRT